MSKPESSKKDQQPVDRRKFQLEPVIVAPWRALPPGYIENNGPCKNLEKLTESGTTIIPSKYQVKEPPPITPWKDAVEDQKEKFRECQTRGKPEVDGVVMVPTKYKIKDPPPITPWKEVVEDQKEKYRQCQGRIIDRSKDGRVVTPTKYKKSC
ncbi:unnamed protein product [Phyllotreta striolata]|uniref:Uncharacterized protein n=1 Tax=Phyllotreta striolata TaxID=444603 RepID=A0A9N9XS67_PHYSR|nr:unnamed protein product [Phyllotreta striolata]